MDKVKDPVCGVTVEPVATPHKSESRGQTYYFCSPGCKKTFDTSTRTGGLDWVMAVVSGWLIGGAWLDAWAHINLPELETFFTPWHGVLYSGLLATLGVLITWWVRGLLAGRPASAALPYGYGLSLVGGLLFAAGGLSDMVWHTLFGIEADVEALLSPTHLLLALGAFLMVGGPLRAAWNRPTDEEDAGWDVLAPALLSLAFTLSILTFFSEYANPFTVPWPGTAPISHWPTAGVPDERTAVPGPIAQSLGLASIMLQAGILMGGVLLALRRWKLPFGAVTLVFTLTIGPAVASHGQYQFIPAALLSGFIADILLMQLRPTGGRNGRHGVFAFSAPAVLFACYFLTLAITEGISWSVHLWAGSIFQAGVVGLLLSYLVVPPPAVVERRQ